MAAKLIRSDVNIVPLALLQGNVVVRTKYG